MHACASLTAFPVFSVGQPRERNRINRLRSQSIMEWYAIEVKIPWFYAAFRVRSRQVKGFIPLLSKWRFYCVTDKEKTGKKQSLLTRLSSHPVWQLPYFSLLVDTCFMSSYLQVRFLQVILDSFLYETENHGGRQAACCSEIHFLPPHGVLRPVRIRIGRLSIHWGKQKHRQWEGLTHLRLQFGLRLPGYLSIGYFWYGRWIVLRRSEQRIRRASEYSGQ